MDAIKQYIIALTNLYGQVPASKVTEIYNSQNDTQLSTQDVEAYLEEDMSQAYVYGYQGHFVHETVMEFNMFKKLRKQKRKLPYYVPEKQELLKYADMLYYEKPKAFHQLQRHLEQRYFKKDPGKAEMLTQNIRWECLEGLNKKRFAALMASFEVVPKNQQQTSKIIDMVTELSNNLRRWELNGHTPKELGEMGCAYQPFSSSLLERIKAFLGVNFNEWPG